MRTGFRSAMALICLAATPAGSWPSAHRRLEARVTRAVRPGRIEFDVMLRRDCMSTARELIA